MRRWSDDKQDDEQVLAGGARPRGADGFGSREGACLALGDGARRSPRKIGCTAQTLHQWVGRAERDSGRKPGLTTDMAAKLKTLERENRELRQANEILRKASAYFDGVDAPARRHCNVSLADPLRATRRSDIHASSCDYRR